MDPPNGHAPSLRNDGSSHVVIVDDDADVRLALSRLLRSAGLRVVAFPSAEALLGEEFALLPVCLVLDIHLGGMNGLDLAGGRVKSLRGNDAGQAGGQSQGPGPLAALEDHGGGFARVRLEQASRAMLAARTG